MMCRTRSMSPGRGARSVACALAPALALACVSCRSTPEAAATEAPWLAVRGYACPRAAGPVVLDGRPDEDAWSNARWSDPFVDIEGDARPEPRFETRMKMVWDDEHLYVAAQMEEPDVWATLTEHDEIVFHDNDFEVFIDPDGDRQRYFEIEVNALGTIFDLFLPRTYIDGGGADHDWNLEGLETAVHVVGTINDPSDVDTGWSVELAMPWSAFGADAGMPLPPGPGDTWRVNFSRVEWRLEVIDGAYERVPDTPEDNWVWSPQGVIDMHRPERWGFVTFVGDGGGR